ncbi:hypothetical protein EDB87DRAFT_1579164 [Lactarius vividus]|nr:hypothetical protein EDB87DRAFT_1579164 [Lactarius vividus]
MSFPEKYGYIFHWRPSAGHRVGGNKDEVPSSWCDPENLHAYLYVESGPAAPPEVRVAEQLYDTLWWKDLNVILEEISDDDGIRPEYNTALGTLNEGEGHKTAKGHHYGGVVVTGQPGIDIPSMQVLSTSQMVLGPFPTAMMNPTSHVLPFGELPSCEPLGSFRPPLKWREGGEGGDSTSQSTRSRRQQYPKALQKVGFFCTDLLTATARGNRRSLTFFFLSDQNRIGREVQIPEIATDHIKGIILYPVADADPRDQLKFFHTMSIEPSFRAPADKMFELFILSWLYACPNAQPLRCFAIDQVDLEILACGKEQTVFFDSTNGLRSVILSIQHETKGGDLDVMKELIPPRLRRDKWRHVFTLPELPKNALVYSADFDIEWSDVTRRHVEALNEKKNKKERIQNKGRLLISYSCPHGLGFKITHLNFALSDVVPMTEVLSLASSEMAGESLRWAQIPEAWAAWPTPELIPASGLRVTQSPGQGRVVESG